MMRDRAPRLTAMSVLLFALSMGTIALATSACGQKASTGSGAEPTPSGAPATSASASTAAASSSASSASAAKPSASSTAEPATTAAPDPKPVGDGVTSFVPAGQTEACKAQTGDIASYLQRPEVTIAGREGALAASWLLKLSATKPGAQLAFAGFALDAKQLARARGIGQANEVAPRIFSNGAGFTLVWFDEDGLAYTQPRWETTPPPKIEHLRAISNAAADDVALAETPSGSIIAVAPFNMDKAQLGMFSFAPTDAAAPPVQALGATHHAKQPRWPSVVADANGYTLAWHEQDGRIVVSRFDLTGKEIDAAHTLASQAAAGVTRERVSLVPTAKGALAVWAEGDALLARAVDQTAHPSDKTFVIAKGRFPVLESLGDGAIVSFVGADGATQDVLLAVKVGPDGAPSAKGLRVSDGAGAVKDQAAVTQAGQKMAFLWVEPMSATISTKRAILRTIDAACIP